jgi:ribosomal protein S18 acetylase RimI-like enzyme
MHDMEEKMRIELLDSEVYKGKQIPFIYRTDHYFDIMAVRGTNGDSFTFVEKKFETEIEKRFTDTLLEDWLENPKLFGAFEGDTVIGYLELSHEKWNNRMRVSNIWVETARRGQGIGKKLMAVAEQTAIEAKARMLILETQSCNYNAICFYRSCGMSIIGFDLFAYSNDDIDKKEVRIEMGKKTGVMK